MPSKLPLIIIIGPTASGKTSLAVELAKHFNTEVISADSRQIYKYLTIGTAKPNSEEMQGVKHHLIDILEPDKDYSAGMFEDDAEAIVQNLHLQGKIPILAGGSGLYVKALVDGLFGDNKSEKTLSIRKELNDKLSNFGKDYLYNELMSVDPVSAEKYADKNTRRVIRALEFYYSEGKLFSEAHEKDSVKSKYLPIYIALNWDRETIYNRINRRTELMWEQGLIEETNAVLEMGYTKDLNSLNTVGYKECIAFLEGKMTKEEAIEEMKKNTRRYAKRQMTWNRSIENVKYISPADTDIIAESVEYINFKLGEINE
jgi:tRNA dimethylallyltransferase